MKPVPLSWDHQTIFDTIPVSLRQSSDFNFFNQYIWKTVVDTHIFLDDTSFLIQKKDAGQFRFYCSDNYTYWLSEIQKMELPKKKYLYLLQDQFDTNTTTSSLFHEDKDQGEYLYKYETIRGFKGQKLQKKRNHLNFFLKTYPEHSIKIFSTYTDHQNELLPFFSNEEEYAAYIQFTKYPLTPNLLPLGLFVGNELVAFTLGDIINSTCIIHFEKAKKEVRGSYQAIFYYLMECLQDKHITWINREQDLGLEHLRISKMSYYPDSCIKKYKAIIP